MHEETKLTLFEFVSQHWELFKSLCSERGEDADAIYVELGGEEE